MRSVDYHILSLLKEKSDADYKTFQCSLIPNIPAETVIGVRSPVLRKIAKSFANSEEAVEFINSLPHTYYEENNLHGYMIAQIKSCNDAVRATDAFLPYIDNWATCDSLNPLAFKNHKSELTPYIDKWLLSDHTYTVRFAVRMLMNYYIGDENCFEKVNAIKKREYYIDMMIAWFYATALATHWDSALPFVLSQSDFIRAKTIRKAIESRRITLEQKRYLRNL